MSRYRTAVPCDALSPVDREDVARLLADLGTRLLNNKVVGLNIEFEVVREHREIRFDPPPVEYLPDEGSFVVSVSFTLSSPSPSPPINIPVPVRQRSA